MAALAVAWLASPALAGVVEGMAAYERGDYETAHRELLEAAEQGDAGAQFILGVMYDKGEGVPRDDAEAVRWFRQAAEQGLAAAQFNLGLMYAEGEGVPQDYAEAVRWFRQAAEQGDAEAQYNLGVMYTNGKGVPQDYAEAERWYRQAAEQGDAGAQYNLGVMYRMGHGVESDSAEAERWYRQAAEQGHAQAQFNLGGMYANGWDVPRDYAEAARWYRRAAEQGAAGSLATVAQNKLGVMYEEGKGVPRDYVEAYKWYSLAAARSDGFFAELNARNLDNLEGRMTAAQVAEAQERARNWQPSPGTDPSNVSNAPEDRDRQPTSTGTGFLVNNAGYVLTNHHVVADCARVRTSLPGDDAEIRAHDATNDLALLAVRATDSMQSASFRVQQVRLGEEVMAVGYPLHGLVGQSLNVTRGEVSALSGIGGDSRHLQITAPVQPGNSGGPLLDRAGRVTGVVIGTLDALGVAALTGNIPQNVNFAIRSGVARAFLDAHAVSYDTSSNDRKRPTEAIAEAARTHTVIIECWN